MTPALIGALVGAIGAGLPLALLALRLVRQLRDLERDASRRIERLTTEASHAQGVAQELAARLRRGPPLSVDRDGDDVADVLRRAGVVAPPRPDA